MRTVSLKEAEYLVLDVLKAKLVPMLHSSPGIGKSDLVRKIGKDNSLKVIDMRLSQMDPTDLNGFPTINKVTNRSDFAPPLTIPLEGDTIPEGYNGWILFLDEINSAPPSMQAAAYKIVLDKMVGQQNIHEHVYMVAAGNLATDKAIVNRLSTAMQSRLIHIVVNSNEDDWFTWATENQLDYRVIGFLRFRSELLHKFNPKHNDLTFPCPRTWEFVSRIIKSWDVIPTEKIPLLCGTVGEGPAIELQSFISIFKQLPTREEIINNPGITKVPDEPSTLYAVTALLSNIIKESNIDKIMIYLERLPIEFQVISLQNLFKVQPLLTDTKAGKGWIKRNAKEFL